MEEAYVALVQATQRVKRIYEISKVRAAVKAIPTPIPSPTEATGNFCPRCFSGRLNRKGAGCTSCLACGFDLGCGG